MIFIFVLFLRKIFFKLFHAPDSIFFLFLIFRVLFLYSCICKVREFFFFRNKIRFLKLIHWNSQIPVVKKNKQWLCSSYYKVASNIEFFIFNQKRIFQILLKNLNFVFIVEIFLFKNLGLCTKICHLFLTYKTLFISLQIINQNYPSTTTFFCRLAYPQISWFWI